MLDIEDIYKYKYLKYKKKYLNMGSRNQSRSNDLDISEPVIFVKTMDKMNDIVYGENSSPEYDLEAVGDLRVAFFFKLVRNITVDEIDKFIDLIVELSNKVNDRRVQVDLVVMTYQTRDIRGGKGERKIFYYMLIYLYNFFPKTILALLALIPYYGYFKDYFLIIEMIYDEYNIEDNEYNKIIERIYDLVVKQLKKDFNEYERWLKLKSERNDQQESTLKLSLLVKYIPKENKRFDRKYKIVDSICKRLFDFQNMENKDNSSCRREYRKIVSKLNRVLDIPEIKMSARKFSEINFQNISGKALFKYRKAFLYENIGGKEKEIEDRIKARERFLEFIKSPSNKSRQFEIYDIIRVVLTSKYSSDEEGLFQKLWDSVKTDILNAIKGDDEGIKDINFTNIIPIIDVSGSMTGTPMYVAISLGIMLSEITEPLFRDRFITFSEDPTWVNLSNETGIVNKIKIALGSKWGMSTNFEAVYNMILDVVVAKKLRQSEIPDLIVFSDMQFDQARESNDPWETHHEIIVRRFKEAGIQTIGEPYIPPKIIYWNLRADTLGFPIQANTPNTVMISGFSPKLFKHILFNKNLSDFEIPTPYETLRNVLDDSRYDIVRDIISIVGEIGMKI